MNITSMHLLADTWGTNGHMGGGWWIVMMVGMALFWGAIIIGIAWLIRGSSDGWGEGRRETPLEILERRFAEGAISPDEYHERREAMTSGSIRHRSEPASRPGTRGGAMSKDHVTPLRPAAYRWATPNRPKGSQRRGSGDAGAGGVRSHDVER